MSKSITLILISIIIAVGGQFCLKKGMNLVGKIGTEIFSYPLATILKIFSNFYIIIGLLFYAVSAFLWLIVLSRVDLSFAYPFVGLTYVFVLLVSKFAFKEDVNLIRWLGALIILLGVILISRT